MATVAIWSDILFSPTLVMHYILMHIEFDIIRERFVHTADSKWTFWKVKTQFLIHSECCFLTWIHSSHFNSLFLTLTDNDVSELMFILTCINELLSYRVFAIIDAKVCYAIYAIEPWCCEDIFIIQRYLYNICVWLSIVFYLIKIDENSYTSTCGKLFENEIHRINYLMHIHFMRIFQRTWKSCFQNIIITVYYFPNPKYSEGMKYTYQS